MSTRSMLTSMLGVPGGEIGSATDVIITNPLQYQALILNASLKWVNSYITENSFSFSDNTTANATSTKHGLLPKLSGDSSDVFFGDGTFGSLAAATATSNQAFTAQTSVTVTHNLGVYPLVQVNDSDGKRIIPLEITDDSVNQFTVTFTDSTTGTIIYR